MNRYAFLPVRVDLELSELTGTIRFGVNKMNTFVCFVEEPFTRFAVQSSVGTLSSLIRARVRPR